MTVARSLRTIEADLHAMLAEPTLDRDVIELAARRIGAQAEMLELDLDKLEPAE